MIFDGWAMAKQVAADLMSGQVVTVYTQKPEDVRRRVGAALISLGAIRDREVLVECGLRIVTGDGGNVWMGPR